MSMLVGDLKKWPKLYELCLKYYAESARSGDFSDQLPIASLFVFKETHEGEEFWLNLSHMKTGVCESRYPELFNPKKLEKEVVEPEVTIETKDIAELSLLAQIIVSQNTEYNGHFQLELNTHVPFLMLQELMDELEGYYDNPIEYRCCSDGSGSIYVMQHWEEGEHPLGHKDKLLMSFGSLDGKGY